MSIVIQNTISKTEITQDYQVHIIGKPITDGSKCKSSKLWRTTHPGGGGGEEEFKYKQQTSLDDFLVEYRVSHHVVRRLFAYYLLNVMVIRFLKKTFTKPLKMSKFYLSDLWHLNYLFSRLTLYYWSLVCIQGYKTYLSQTYGYAVLSSPFWKLLALNTNERNKVICNQKQLKTLFVFKIFLHLLLYRRYRI